MTTVLLSKAARAALIIDQFIRNGFIPKAALQNLLGERAGQAAKWRAKQVFRTVGNVLTIPASAGAGPRYRWPFPWHSGPYVRAVGVYMLLAKQNNSGSSDAYGALHVYDPSGTEVGIAKVRYGNAGGLATTDVPSEWGEGLAVLVNPLNEDNDVVTLSPDTEYTAVFADYNDARLIAACVWEVSLDSDTDNGFPAITTPAQAPIVDTDRSTPLEMGRAVWKGCGTPVFHWCAETEADAPSQGSGSTSGTLTQSVGDVTAAGAGTTAGGVLSESIGNVTLTGAGGGSGLDITMSDDAGGAMWPNNTPLPIHVDVVASGVAQTGASVTVWIYDNYGTNVISGVSNTGTDGWSSTGWSESFGTWQCTFTKASLAPGSYRFDISVALGLNSGHVYAFVPVNQTDQHADPADPSINSLDVHLRFP